MHPEILSRLFTKFATKSITGGTGLGLFISKSIIEARSTGYGQKTTMAISFGNSTGVYIRI